MKGVSSQANTASMQLRISKREEEEELLVLTAKVNCVLRLRW